KMKFEKEDKQNDWKLETWNLKLETPFVPRRSRPKYPTPGARRKRRGGGLRWLLALVLVAGAVCFWREHEQPKRIVHVSAPAPAPVAARPQVQPLTVSRQSPADFPRPVHD